MALNTGDNALHFATFIDNSGLRKGAFQAQGIIQGLTSNISKMDVFAGLSVGAVLAFTKISTSAFNTAKDLETAMKEVQTISQATQEDFEGMKEAIIAVGLEVPQTSEELTKAFYQIKVDPFFDIRELGNVFIILNF